MLLVNRKRLLASFCILFLLCGSVLWSQNLVKDGLSTEVVRFSEVFPPVYLNELYDLVEQSPETKEELDALFKVARKINELPGNDKKIIAYSLFWKPSHTGLSVPIVNKQTVYQSKNEDRLEDKTFYQTYVKPLSITLSKIPKIYPGWGVRIYLANDLAFLIDDLFCRFPFVEVFLMESNSIAHNPGAMWRLLVFDDPNVAMASIRDSDDKLSGSTERAVADWLNGPDTKGFYRKTLFHNRVHLYEGKGQYEYSPIYAGSCGGKLIHSMVQMEKAMKGYILYRERNPNAFIHPSIIVDDIHPQGFGNKFPAYGFDESFLRHVIYYSMAHKGLLTTLPNSVFLPLSYPVSKNNPVLSDYFYVNFIH